MKMASQLDSVKALAFDVFGTVVDWRGSIIREGESWSRARGPKIEWAQFADRWRAAYRPSMDKVRQGKLPWTRLDDLHRRVFDELLVEFKLGALTEAGPLESRLASPDAVAGLGRRARAAENKVHHRYPLQRQRLVVG
jgi:2-haloacid dehalogenase